MRKNEWEKYFPIHSTLCGRSFTRPAVSLVLLLLRVTSKTTRPSSKGTSSLKVNLRQSWSSQITSIIPHKSRSCHLNIHTGSWIPMHSEYTNVNVPIYQRTSKRLRLNICLCIQHVAHSICLCVYIYVWNVSVAKSCRIIFPQVHIQCVCVFP